jgi:hypothetical protein
MPVICHAAKVLGTYYANVISLLPNVTVIALLQKRELNKFAIRLIFYLYLSRIA